MAGCSPISHQAYAVKRNGSGRGNVFPSPGILLPGNPLSTAISFFCFVEYFTAFQNLIQLFNGYNGSDRKG